MNAFRSWRSYQRFVNAVRYTNRFIYDDETREFLELVIDTAGDRSFDLDAGSTLLRAQLGSEWVSNNPDDEDAAGQEMGFPPERMKPIRGRSREGRANPAGITYLYLSDEKNTAMAELRPWVDAPISLGEFLIVRDLRLVDCSHAHRGLIVFGSEPTPEKRREHVWRDIDRAFARPITLGEDPTGYIPTQILSEQFRAAGYDGVVHRSSVGRGRNFILFNLDDAVLTACGLYAASFIDYDFRERGNPYWVKNTDSK